MQQQPPLNDKGNVNLGAPNHLILQLQIEPLVKLQTISINEF